jgi:hypothetical protein
VHAATQGPTSQPELSEAVWMQSVAAAVEVDHGHLDETVVLEDAHPVDRRAKACSSVFDLQETGISACSQEGQTALADKPFAVDGAASVGDHHSAVEVELALRARQKQNRPPSHPGYASYPWAPAAKRLYFPDNGHRDGGHGLAKTARWHSAEASPVFGREPVQAHC